MIKDYTNIIGKKVTSSVQMVITLIPKSDSSILIHEYYNNYSVGNV